MTNKQQLSKLNKQGTSMHAQYFYTSIPTSIPQSNPTTPHPKKKTYHGRSLAVSF